MIASTKSSNTNEETMTAILPLGRLHRDAPNISTASAATNVIPTTSVKSGMPNSLSVWWYVIKVLREWFASVSVVCSIPFPR